MFGVYIVWGFVTELERWVWEVGDTEKAIKRCVCVCVCVCGRLMCGDRGRMELLLSWK